MGILGWYLIISGLVCLVLSLAATLKFWHRYGHENQKPNSRFFFMVIRLTVVGMFWWPVVMCKHLHDKADELSAKGALEDPDEDTAGESEQEDSGDVAVDH